MFCTSPSLLMPRARLSPHSWFSPGFCASCTRFYLYVALPTALLNTSPCFALSCSHYSASPSFPFLLPLHVVFLMVLPASKPVSPPILPSWSSLPFHAPAAGPHLLPASPKPRSDYADPHPLHIWLRCLLTRCLDASLLFGLGHCSAWSIPELWKCGSGQKGADPACDSTVSHFEETFLGPEGLWTSVRLLVDEQDV